MLNRRAFLRTAGASCAGLSLPRCLFAATLQQDATWQLTSGKQLASLPANFTGLGFEMSSAAMPGLLSKENSAYRNLVQGLGPKGVLRFGGIVADYTRYQRNGRARSEPKDTVLNRDALLQLRGFLDATDWTAIWSVNFGRGTLEEAVTEAKDVSAVLGPRLTALELGNEVENYGKGSEPRRLPPYAYETFRTEYARWHAAIVRAIPAICFAAPDTAASLAWVERMAADARGEVQLLTTHYYRGDQRLGTQDQLLRPDPQLDDALRRLGRASQESGLPWRMCETNSFFGGGRPGVSDTLAGALWTLDYMLRLASAGCAGVNMETGVNQLGFVSSYSPIPDDGAGHASAGVPYYGMLAFAQAARNTTGLVEAVFSSPTPDTFSAYVLAKGGKPASVVLINRAASGPVQVGLRHLSMQHANVLRLTGAGLDRKDGVILGGSAVGENGMWKAISDERATEVLTLQPASAAVLHTASSA